MKEKLFAVPFTAFSIDRAKERFVLDVPQEVLKNAPGFDKKDWPDMADPAFRNQIQDYYRSYPLAA